MNLKEVLKRFEEVLTLPDEPSQRQYIEAVKEVNPTEYSLLSDLLVAHYQGHDLLSKWDNPSANGESEDDPNLLGERYVILRKIGEGGMSTVYLAEQQTPFRRHVAIKLILPFFDFHRIEARFKLECETLARVKGENVCRIFDSGVTASGRPFFVMEYIEGLDIVAYCDAHKLTIEERVRLMVKVSQVVHSIHSQGVIHRDIKPAISLSNIVTANRLSS